MSLNQCSFIGNLGRDPETRYTANGDAICTFSIGVTEKWTDTAGEKKERTEWVRVVAYRKLAEICEKYLVKGQQVFVQGRMQSREWEDKDGNKRSTTEIIADTMKMLGGRREGSDSWKEPKRDAQQVATQRRPAQSADNLDDDIPF